LSATGSSQEDCLENVAQNTNSPRSKGVDEKFCESCGEAIKIKAELCPKCGVRQRTPVNKTALLLLTFFLGGFGAHKFYLGKPIQGILYLIFCWTFIPGFVALIEFFIYAFTPAESLDTKNAGSKSGSGVLVLGIIAAVLGGVFVIGILSALAIPKMFAVSAKAKMAEAPGVIANWETLESAYAQETKKVGSEDAIGFASPNSTSKYWSYSSSVNGKHEAIMVATTKTALGECPVNSRLTSTYNAKTDQYVHEASPDCKSYIPNF
jgi:TM2 domain-containing membrane protein YozV